MANVAKFKQKDQFAHKLVFPDGEVSDIVFVLAGPTHQARKDFAGKLWRQKAREQNRKGRQEIPEDFEEIVDGATELLVVSTLDVQNLQFGEVLFKHSPAEVRKLYQDPEYLWIRNQIDAALKDDAELFTDSPAS